MEKEYAYAITYTALYTPRNTTDESHFHQSRGPQINGFRAHIQTTALTKDGQRGRVEGKRVSYATRANCVKTEHWRWKSNKFISENAERARDLQPPAIFSAGVWAANTRRNKKSFERFAQSIANSKSETRRSVYSFVSAQLANLSASRMHSYNLLLWIFCSFFFIKIYSPSIIPRARTSEMRNNHQKVEKERKNHQNASSDYGRHKMMANERRKKLQKNDFYSLNFWFSFCNHRAPTREQFNVGLRLLFRTKRFGVGLETLEDWSNHAQRSQSIRFNVDTFDTKRKGSVTDQTSRLDVDTGRVSRNNSKRPSTFDLFWGKVSLRIHLNWSGCDLIFNLIFEPGAVDDLINAADKQSRNQKRELFREKKKWKSASKGPFVRIISNAVKSIPSFFSGTLLPVAQLSRDEQNGHHL